MEDTQNGKLSSLDWVNIRNHRSSTCSPLPAPYAGNRGSPWSRTGYSAHFYFLGKAEGPQALPRKGGKPWCASGWCGQGFGKERDVQVEVLPGCTREEQQPSAQHWALTAQRDVHLTQTCTFVLLSARTGEFFSQQPRRAEPGAVWVGPGCYSIAGTSQPGCGGGTEGLSLPGGQMTFPGGGRRGVVENWWVLLWFSM